MDLDGHYVWRMVLSSKFIVLNDIQVQICLLLHMDYLAKVLMPYLCIPGGDNSELC